MKKLILLSVLMLSSFAQAKGSPIPKVCSDTYGSASGWMASESDYSVIFDQACALGVTLGTKIQDRSQLQQMLSVCDNSFPSTLGGDDALNISQENAACKMGLLSTVQ